MIDFKKIYIISEVVDGRIVKTRLSGIEAIKLHQKLLKAGAKVSFDKETENESN